jgi:hypothetical protein
MKIDLNSIPDLPNEDEGCKGLVFIGRCSVYIRNNTVTRKETITLLKRKSCKGCADCGWMMDAVNEAILNGTLILPTIEEGQLYTVTISNISRDRETGIVDDWDVEIIKIKNEGENKCK